MEDKLTSTDLINISNLQSSDELNKKLIEETDPEKLKRIADLFNMVQAKKDILRLEKYSDLIDAITAQMEARIRLKPSEFSNKDLIDYLNAISLNLDKAKKSFDVVENSPTIQINQVNIDNENASISRESREKVTEAIAAIMKKLNMQEQSEDEIIVEQDALLKEEE